MYEKKGGLRFPFFIYPQQALRGFLLITRSLQYYLFAYLSEPS